MSLRLVDPTAASQSETLTLADRPIDSNYTVVALVNNGKPNGDRILHGIKTSLENALHWRIDSELFVKPHASRIMPTNMVNQIVRRCHFAIIGVGD